MTKKIKGFAAKVTTKIIAMVNTKAVRGILIVSCLCATVLALLVAPLNTSGTHGLLYAMVACCALASALSLVQTYNCTNKKQEDATDEV